ncbi:MAG TPA: phosphatase PAP2 family protein, partial [Gemmatimonadales bacterium]|nr:phosphatase PAP2 family protein [Gemmatimonadales bacterium]
IAFAAATAYTTLAVRQQLPHAQRNAVLLYSGAGIVGTLRVAGGRHFPTDVLTGAALGAAVGWLTARLHPVAS